MLLGKLWLLGGRYLLRVQMLLINRRRLLLLPLLLLL
jgi:hypothetical protein